MSILFLPSRAACPTGPPDFTSHHPHRPAVTPKTLPGHQAGTPGRQTQTHTRCVHLEGEGVWKSVSSVGDIILSLSFLVCKTMTIPVNEPAAYGKPLAQCLVPQPRDSWCWCCGLWRPCPLRNHPQICDSSSGVRESPMAEWAPCAAVLFLKARGPAVCK